MFNQWIILNNNRLEILARVVSIILSPLLLWPLLFGYVLLDSQLSTSDRNLSGLIIFGVGIVPSILLFYFLKKSGRISDWELRRRQERYRFNLFVLGWSALMLFLLYNLHLSVLLKLGVVVVSWLTLFTLITFFWKISAHSSTIMLVILLVSQKISIPFLWGLPIVALVSWARIYRQNHTFLQVIGGIFLSCFLYLVAISGGFV